MKKLTIAFLLLTTALTIVGCGGTSDTPEPTEVGNTSTDTTSSETTTSSKGPVQFTMLGTIKPEIQEPFEEAVAAYNAAQDQYKVVIVPFDGDPVLSIAARSDPPIAGSCIPPMFT